MGIQSAAIERAPSVRRGRVAPLSRLNRPHFLGVGSLTAIIAAIYSGFSLVLYHTYREANYDLVIFDQAIRSYSRFHPGVSIIKGLHDGFGPNFSVLGDHFSPIDIALAPLYWIWDGPQALLVAQSVLFALAIPWLWIFTRRALGGSGRKATVGAYLACVGYGLSWPLAAAAAFGYHEVAFVPLLTAIALERLQARRLPAALTALGLLLLVKEDMGLLVAGIGVVIAVSVPTTFRRQRLLGIALVVVGVGFTLFATDVLIPAFGGRANYYWAFSHLGKNVPQVFGHILTHPVQTLEQLFTPALKLTTWKWLFAAFCFLPLLSPLTLAALPLLVERMLSDPQYSHWWGLTYQYNAFIVIILVFAAVDGAVRLDRWVTRGALYLDARRARVGQVVAPAAVGAGGASGTSAAAAATVSLSTAAGEARSDPAAEAGVTPGADAGRGGEAPPAGSGLATTAAAGPITGLGRGAIAFFCCVAIGAAAVCTVPVFALGRALHPGFYEMNRRNRAIAAADAKVPSGTVVAAANFTGAELSRRDTVLMWDDGRYTPPFAAPWVIADVWRPELGFTSVAAQSADVTMLERHGYRVVFQRLGFIVLHRAGPPHLGTAAQGGGHVNWEAAG